MKWEKYCLKSIKKSQHYSGIFKGSRFKVEG
jgi:hypothetical protein